MSSFTVINLSKLPAPKVIEKLDYEKLLQEYYQDFFSKDESYDALLESDPAMAILQAGAYREMLLRQRINESAKANLLAYATGSDLDQKAASYGVSRLEAESDDRLRYRCQLSLEGYSTAGPVGAYIFHALSASAKVKSVAVESPQAGEVLVTVLSTEGNGIPSKRESVTDIQLQLQNNSIKLDGKNITDLVVKNLKGEKHQEGTDYIFDKNNSLLLRIENSNISQNEQLLFDYRKAGVLELVELHLNDEDIRPLTDLIKVRPTEIIEYSIEAIITVYQGPSFAVVENQGRELLEEYVKERHTVGGLVALSGIHEALHTKGVKKVELIEPQTDIVTTNRQAPYCKEIKLKTIIDYDISADSVASEQL